MRHVLLLASATLVGCAIENELRYTATLDASTHGVVLTDDGLQSHAAMSGTTCTIDPRWGCPTDDADLPTEDETVVDHHGGITLGRSAVGVHTITGSAWDAVDDLLLTDVRVARLTDAGRVVLAGTPQTCALHVDGADPTGVPESLCAEGVRASVDRERSDLWVAADDGLYRVGARGIARFGSDGADRVARDATRRLTFLAHTGGTALRALDDDGSPVWSVATGGSIRSMATRGDKGDVLVLVSRPDGFGVIERRDGASGLLRSASEVPDGDGELAVSGNGAAIAIVRADQVHYYAMDVAGEQAVVDPTPPRCMQDDFATQD